MIDTVIDPPVSILGWPLRTTESGPLYRFNIFFSAAAKQNNPSSRAAVQKAQQTMLQWGVAPDRVTINAQINYAIKEGRLEDAIETFEQALNGVSQAS